MGPRSGAVCKTTYDLLVDVLCGRGKHKIPCPDDENFQAAAEKAVKDVAGDVYTKFKFKTDIDVSEKGKDRKDLERLFHLIGLKNTERYTGERFVFGIGKDETCVDAELKEIYEHLFMPSTSACGYGDMRRKHVYQNATDLLVGVLCGKPMDSSIPRFDDTNFQDAVQNAFKTVTDLVPKLKLNGGIDIEKNKDNRKDWERFFHLIGLKNTVRSTGEKFAFEMVEDEVGHRAGGDVELREIGERLFAPFAYDHYGQCGRIYLNATDVLADALCDGRSHFVANGIPHFDLNSVAAVQKAFTDVAAIVPQLQLNGNIDISENGNDRKDWERFFHLIALKNTVRAEGERLRQFSNELFKGGALPEHTPEFARYRARYSLSNIYVGDDYGFIPDVLRKVKDKFVEKFNETLEAGGELDVDLEDKCKKCWRVWERELDEFSHGGDFANYVYERVISDRFETFIYANVATLSTFGNFTEADLIEMLQLDNVSVLGAASAFMPMDFLRKVIDAFSKNQKVLEEFKKFVNRIVAAALGALSAVVSGLRATDKPEFS
jgi:hypothetical protein